ncbi:MAG TPA: sulfurtransferase TusA family protein [Coriobacteriia bacterium]|nr:sulfurtransferase TusA family protein [Coriobacteriia bacterium]
MVEVDARGLSCPLPVMRAKQALSAAPDRLVVRVDSGTAKANVSSMLADEGYDVSVSEEPDHFRIEASRT